MHLQRIRVPDFRVLKDVDITFEKDFVPRIFPLGSLNGGGKSTLLQLIFTLLHCSTNPERKPFVQNLLNGFNIREDSPKRTLAMIDIWDNSKTVAIDFFCCKNGYIQEMLQFDNNSSQFKGNVLFLAMQKLEEINQEIRKLQEFIDYLEYIDTQIIAYKEGNFFGQEIEQIEQFFKKLQSVDRKTSQTIEKHKLTREVTSIAESLNNRMKKQLEELLKEYSQIRQEIEPISTKVAEYMKSNNWIFISEYRLNEEEINLLICHVDGIDVAKSSETKMFLDSMAEKIFFAAPSTQLFLFMEQKSRNLLFKSKLVLNKDYYSKLKDARKRLINLFTYDFLAVDILIQAFKDARDRDFREAIETGEYGNNYQRLKNELNQMLFNKKINIDKDFNGVNFTLDRNGETIELSPEDLSHGELKRLSIYMWLKHHNIEDAIVLMDEIEIAFHPDWQYQIISDLQEWAPNNQYILATHSYELCQALTPAHVKELEPKLIKQYPEN
ncbi:MAG: AAA family ATPase [Coleofasciculus chthonoplastes F3-SA18-01]|uniref:AAA family ATPase n=1 Tax=Coleofasciculus chthonoplastes TaxID=64178 RepID=UPI0032FADED1